MRRLSLLLLERNDIETRKLSALDGGGLQGLLSQIEVERARSREIDEEVDKTLVPEFDRILNDAYAQVPAKRFIAARSLLYVAQRLVDLTSNIRMEAETSRVIGYLDASTGNHESSLRHYQRAFTQYMTSPVSDMGEEIGTVADIIGVMALTGRAVEAYRFARAMLGHFRYRAGELSVMPLLALARRGSCLLYFGGDMRASVRDAANAYARAVEPFKSGTRIQYATAMVEAGYLSVREMAGGDRRRIPQYRNLTREFLGANMQREAMLSERKDDLEWIERVYRLNRDDLTEDRAIILHVQTECLALALQGNRRRALSVIRFDKTIARHRKSWRAPYWLAAMTALGQMYRLCGRRKKALEFVREVDRNLEDRFRLMIEPHVWRALHYHNALALIRASGAPPELRAIRMRAVAFFEDALRNHYMAYQDVARTYGIRCEGHL